jgi:hypothetical protein
VLLALREQVVPSPARANDHELVVARVVRRLAVGLRGCRGDLFQDRRVLAGPQRTGRGEHAQSRPRGAGVAQCGAEAETLAQHLVTYFY